MRVILNYEKSRHTNSHQTNSTVSVLSPSEHAVPMASAHQASLAFPAREHGSPALSEGSVMESRRVLIIVLPSACMSDPSARCFGNNMALANL